MSQMSHGSMLFFRCDFDVIHHSYDQGELKLPKKSESYFPVSVAFLNRQDSDASVKKNAFAITFFEEEDLLRTG